MTEYVQVLIVANVYRILCLLTGMVFGYLGYRLFVVGVFEKAGELKAALGDKHFTLKQVGPGVFFALFGVLIAGVGGLRSIDLTRSTPVHPNTSGAQPPLANTNNGESVDTSELSYECRSDLSFPRTKNASSPSDTHLLCAPSPGYLKTSEHPQDGNPQMHLDK